MNAHGKHAQTNGIESRDRFPEGLDMHLDDLAHHAPWDYGEI
ncbi:MAG TPA: hypothetical protein VN812_14075 [Candidatus Acidoferrales bacterium]|nr:hypothetical protein [Candidatus Acidoferrales bacterium]